MILPDKKYEIIYADPPWKYKDTASSGKRGASFKYDVQDHEWICSLPVKNITANNCVLFMWVTMPQLPNVFEVIKAWGFEYKTCGFTWVKKNKIKDSWFMGMGNWTRSNSELCLLSVKGKPKRIDASILSVIDTPIEKYSKKPDVVKDHIVKLCGNLPRIELFARQKTKGWDVWGNEVH
jgi:N6-adenosine-specific RNA methylase IME4